MRRLSRYVTGAVAILWISLIVACGGGGGGTKQNSTQSEHGSDLTPRQSTVSPNLDPSSSEKVDRKKLSGILRELRSVEANVERGTTQKALEQYVRRLETELKLLSNQLKSNQEVDAYNQCVRAIDAYDASNYLWQVKEHSESIVDHCVKTNFKATLHMTIPQVTTMQKGWIMMAVVSPNFNWDYSKILSPYKLQTSVVDGATFVSPDALQTIWKVASLATDNVEKMLR